MAVPSLIFPTLIGADIGWTKSPIWSTLTQRATSGKETRLANWTYPLYRFGIPYNFLRSNLSRTELATLMGFIDQCRGMYNPFLFTDAEVNTAALQQIGVGNGTQQNFQLAISYGGFTQPVYFPNGAVTMSPATGSPVVGVNGLVHYTTPPTSLTPVKWSGAFYFGCRLSNDDYEIERFLSGYWKGGHLEFMGGLQDKVT